MAGERGGPPPGVPASVVDLGALRQRPGGDPPAETGMPLGHYANDIQPTVETDGSVTLFFRHLRGGEASDTVAVTMPGGLFLALVGMAGQILPAAHQRMLKQSKQLGDALAAVPQDGGPTGA